MPRSPAGLDPWTRKTGPWSDEEIETLKAHFEEHGAHWVACHLGRGVYATQRRASLLGLHCPRCGERTYLQVLALIRLDIEEYGEHNTDRIAKISGRGQSTVARIVREARIRGDLPPASQPARPRAELEAEVNRAIALAHEEKVRQHQRRYPDHH